MRSTDCEGCFCYAVCDDDLLQADMTLASAGYRLNNFFFVSIYTLALFLWPPIHASSTLATRYGTSTAYYLFFVNATP